jgi:hypothetical protein
MLQWIGSRNKLGLSAVQPIPEDTLYKYRMEDVCKRVVDKKIDLEDEEDWYGGNYNHRSRSWGGYGSGSQPKIRFRVDECLPALDPEKRTFDIMGVAEDGTPVIVQDLYYRIDPGKIISGVKDYTKVFDGVEHTMISRNSITHYPAGTSFVVQKPQPEVPAEDYSGEDCHMCGKKITWAELDTVEWDTKDNLYCNKCKQIVWPDDYNSDGTEKTETDREEEEAEQMTEADWAQYYNREAMTHAIPEEVSGYSFTGMRDGQFEDADGSTWEYNTADNTWKKLTNVDNVVLLEDKRNIN